MKFQLDQANQVAEDILGIDMSDAYHAINTERLLLTDILVNVIKKYCELIELRKKMGLQ